MKPIGDMIIWLAALAFIALTAITPANAQRLNCGNYKDLKTRLAEKYSESRYATMESNTRRHTYELFVSKETGTCSVVMRFKSNNMACLVVGCHSFKVIDEPLPEPGDPV